MLGRKSERPCLPASAFTRLFCCRKGLERGPLPLVSTCSVTLASYPPHNEGHHWRFGGPLSQALQDSQDPGWNSGKMP